MAAFEPGNPERDLLEAHLGPGETPWGGFGVAERQEWQGVVYEAILNACLAESSLAGIYFWGVIDQYNWLNIRRNTDTYPYLPRYPHDNSARTALFGDNPDTPGMREMLWPKPAYHGVRRAIENYFGPAQTICHPVSKLELVRFAANGNVIVLGAASTVETQVNVSAELGENTVFALMSGGNCIAAVNVEPGVHNAYSYTRLYLAGSVIEGDPALERFETGQGFWHPAFRVFGCDGEKIVATIDKYGNLCLAGYLIVDGIPHCLRDFESEDNYYSR